MVMAQPTPTRYPGDVGEMSASDEGDHELVGGSILLGRFHRYDASPPTAELFEPLADLATVIDGVLSQLAGWNLTTADEFLAAALVERGALPVRHFSLMSITLTQLDEPEGDTDLTEAFDVRPLTPVSQVPREVVGLVRAAYPAGHPDEELGSDDDIIRDIQHALDGARLGPLMQPSALVYDGECPVALVLVNRVPGGPPTGGPWITDICRDPDPRYTGLGRDLLLRVLRSCRRSGESCVSLAVTEGNPAWRLYASLGFSRVATTRKVRIPG
jgi:GNAT superfamily N-acetyltransferase